MRAMNAMSDPFAPLAINGYSLDLIIPPSFLRACGYGYQGAKFVGLYWDDTTNELAFHDGRRGLVGAYHQAWDTWWCHPRHETYRQQLFNMGIHFGSRSEPASHMLVIAVGHYMAKAIEFQSAMDLLSAHAPARSEEEQVLMDAVESAGGLDAYLEKFGPQAFIANRPEACSADDISRAYLDLRQALLVTATH